MAKKASKKAVAQEALGAGLIDSSRYSRTVFTDPKTGVRRNSVGNGDAVATALFYVSNDKLDAVARKNSVPDFVGREFVNHGQRRMALGNRLRGAVRHGEMVTIGEFEIKKLDQRVPLPGGESRDKKVKAAVRKAKKASEDKGESLQAAE